MKKKELTNKSDAEKKKQVLQGKFTQRGKQSGSLNPEDYFQKINTESSHEILLSILTSPELFYPVNSSLRDNMISHLHETYGNRNIQKVLQAKLKIGQPNDKYEQEADRMSNLVMQMRGRWADHRIKDTISDEVKNIKLQRNVVTEVSTLKLLPIIGEVWRFPGQPLDKGTRAFMESRFRWDFSRVRIHSGTRAAESAKALEARAYSMGQNVVFAAGQYEPRTTKGRRLLAHELVHVIQNEKDINTIRRWGCGTHQAITKVSAKGIIEDPFFLYDLTESFATFGMDLKEKKLLITGPAFLAGIIKGEGPEHGEDDNYTKEDPATARIQNVKVQNKYLYKAIEHHRTAKKLKDEGAPVHEIGDAYQRMLKALGNACHIAQDRGSHREGVKGMGHDDPRTKNDWDPDDPHDNYAGYLLAVHNTRQLLNTWKMLGGKI